MFSDSKNLTALVIYKQHLSLKKQNKTKQKKPNKQDETMAKKQERKKSIC